MRTWLRLKGCKDRTAKCNDLSTSCSYSYRHRTCWLCPSTKNVQIRATTLPESLWGWKDEEQAQNNFFIPLKPEPPSYTLWAVCSCCINGIHHCLLPVHTERKKRTQLIHMYVILTMTLRLGAKPGPIGQATSLWWTFQHIARFTAKADNTAHCKLFSQTDAMHRNTRIST